MKMNRIDLESLRDLLHPTVPHWLEPYRQEVAVNRYLWSDLPILGIVEIAYRWAKIS